MESPCADSHPLIEILEVTVKPEIGNEKGRVIDGRIRFSGYVKPDIGIVHNPNSDEWVWDEPPVRPMYVSTDSNKARWFLEAFSRCTNTPVEVYLDDNERKPLLKVSRVAIMVSSSGLEGLVLNAAAEGERIFRRIGYFSISGVEKSRASQLQNGLGVPREVITIV